VARPESLCLSVVLCYATVSATIKLSWPATKGFWEIPVLHEDEHLLALESVGARGRPVRRPSELTDLDGLVLPGGESTTM